MKRIFPFCLLALSLFSSCGSDDAKKDDPQPVTPTQPAKIDGMWHLYEVETNHYDGNGNKIGTTKIEKYNKATSTQVFTPPSAYQSTIDGASSAGTYQLKQDSLIIVVPNETIRVKIDSLTTTRLVYTSTIQVASDKVVVTARSSR